MSTPVAGPGRWLVTDLDNTLFGNRTALSELVHFTQAAGISIAPATGRSPSRALAGLASFGVPRPRLVIASVGAELLWDSVALPGWPADLTGWDAAGIRAALGGIAGLGFQPESEQRPHKVSLIATSSGAPSAVADSLARALFRADILVSHGDLIDVLPVGVNKGSALLHAMQVLGIHPSQVMVAGDGANDIEMLSLGLPAVVVANHCEEVERLRGRPWVFFAPRSHAGGIRDGMTHFGWG